MPAAPNRAGCSTPVSIAWRRARSATTTSTSSPPASRRAMVAICVPWPRASTRQPEPRSERGPGAGRGRLRIQRAHRTHEHLRSDGAVPLVALEPEGHVVAPGLAQRGRVAPHPEPDGAAAEAAQLDRHADVLSLAHRLDRGQRRGRCQQRHTRVPQPARLEAGQLVGQLQRQLGGSHHGVDVHGPAQVLPVQSRSRVLRQQLGEAFDPERVDRQARGGAMAAELLQLPGARAQPGVQVVGGDAASRALGTLVADRDQHHRPAVALDQPRRHDPDHALVPVGRRQHVGAPLAPGGVASLHLLCGQLEDLLLDRLAAAVQALELRGQLAGAIIVIGQQQVEGNAGVPQPPGRVDARAEPEAEVTRRDARAVDAGGRHQRPQPRLGGARHAAQAGPHQPTVLVQQRHHVGHGGQRHQVEVLVELVAIASAARVQRLGQLQHHAGAAQLRERVVRRPGADSAGSRAAARQGDGGRSRSRPCRARALSPPRRSP